MSGGGSRVSIPNNMKKTIQNIKEITGNHSEEEIYAILKDCSMDPNETAQKLLYQDPFHEVKRKCDRRKENVNTREPVESRWRPGSQGRGSRGAQGNFSSRYTSHDAGGGKNSGPGNNSGTSQVPDKGGGGSRVSIPNNMKKTIQNIKEITGNHSEEEIYAILKECSMDPNETVQKLLYQVSQNVNTREPVESRWRPGSQGRGSRGARGNFSSRYTSHDAGGGKNSGPGNDSGTSQVPDKGVGPSLPTSNDTKDKETTPAAM